MKIFPLLAIAAILTTGLMADKCSTTVNPPAQQPPAQDQPKQ